MKLFIVASESAGHIAPSLVLAQQWHDKTGGSVHALTGSSKKNAAFISKHATLPVTTHTFFLGTVPYTAWWRWPLFLCQLGFASTKALFLMFWHRPTTLLTTGGVLAIPIYVAAWVYRLFFDIEWLVYELNAELGLAIKVLARLTGTIHSTWPTAIPQLQHQLPQTTFIPTDYPTRFTAGSRRLSQKACHSHLQSVAPTTSKPQKSLTTILVLGGSQGSEQINQLMIDWTATLSPQLCAQIRIIHQTGSGNIKLEQQYYQKGIAQYVFGYDTTLAPLYRLADLVLCRAGAGTLAELAFFKKKALLLPLRAQTTLHQLANAHAFSKTHDATVVTPDEVLPELDRLIHLPRHTTTEQLQDSGCNV